MTNKIDIIIAIILFFFFLRGCYKGFIKTLLGPLSLVASLIAAYTYYNKTQEILIASSIAILGPFALHILFSIIFSLWKKVLKRKDELSALSRLAGGCVNMTWSGSYFIISLLLITMIPFNFGRFGKFKNALLQTKTYELANKYFGESLPLLKDIKKMAVAVSDTETIKKMQESKEFTALLNDEKIKELFKDEELKQYLEKKDIAKIVSNESFQEVLKDKELVGRFIKAVNESSAVNEIPIELKNEDLSKPARPKIIEIK